MKLPVIKTALLFLIAASAAVSTSSCGTVRGFGRDVENVGDNIERSAR